MKKIVLIGFMGSGKSTIGKALADKMGMGWLDLDTYIEEKTQQTIRQIFDEAGEGVFRKIESDCLQECLKSNVPIIATGGGIITTLSNIPYLKAHHTVYLSYPFETLYQRIAGDEARPLATSYESLKTRYESRLPFYEEAAIQTVVGEGKNIEAICEEILKSQSKKRL